MLSRPLKAMARVKDLSWPFYLVVVVGAIVLTKAVVMTPISLVTGQVGTPVDVRMLAELKSAEVSPAQVVVMLALLVPPLETLAGQLIPIWVLKKLGVRSQLGLVTGSAVVFGLLHGLQPLSFLGGFISGVFFSYTFVVFREHSLKKAFLMTAGVHGLENLIAAVGLVLMFRGVLS